jgi:C-terminal processing protease CtpA/Prc
MPAFLKTKGMIIDMRCYPSDNIYPVLAKYLLPESTRFARITNVYPQIPGLFAFTGYSEAGAMNPNYYRGKIVIIVNEITQSAAEFMSMALRAAPNATVLGSTTAGADGNVSRFSLPGGITTMISGIGIYYPDGRETQRVGIIPDHTIQPTIQGIIQDRDELLEKAIAIINEKYKIP